MCFWGAENGGETWREKKIQQHYASSSSCPEGGKGLKVLSQLTNQHLSEVVSHEKVEDGVDGTVQKGQRPGHNVQGFDDLLRASSWPAIKARGDPHIAHDVVGCKEYREDRHCQNH